MRTVMWTVAALAAVVSIIGVELANHRTLVAFLESPTCCDGVVSINQPKARAGGVTASDAPGFPVTIDAGGSYRLTSNLTVADADVSAIEIIKEDDLVRGVTLDLNGFRIEGPGLPPNGNGANLSCTATGDGVGIEGPNFGGGQGTDWLVIGNGTIFGMGERAISCGRCRVDGILASANGGGGITALDGR